MFIREKLLSWASRYELHRAGGEDDLLVVACTVVIDLSLASRRRD